MHKPILAGKLRTYNSLWLDNNNNNNMNIIYSMEQSPS